MDITRSDLAGLLLVASFAFWFPAAALPPRVWTAPLGEGLALIAVDGPTGGFFDRDGAEPW
jgi:hypothetical protein